MENTTTISVSAATHIGTACTLNDDRIYANGKFLHQSLADYAQYTLEVHDGKCLFALSDGMEDEDSGISIINDLRKFHQKAQGSSKDIHVKLDDLVQCVEQTSNLLHSISLGDSDFREKKTAFAALLIDEGSIAAVNLGDCRIYKLEGDTFKLLVNDYKRAERLLKMGIISNEQAELLSGQQKTSILEGRSTVKKSDINPLREDITYLICSAGLTDSVSEDAIYDILASNSNPDEAASMLVAEAVKNDGQDNVTTMVIKIESADAEGATAPDTRGAHTRAAHSARLQVRGRNMPASAKKNSIDIGTIVSMTILVLLVAAVVFGGYKLWTRVRNPESRGVSQETTVSGTEDSTATPPPVEEEDPAGGDVEETTTEGAIDIGAGNNTGTENTDLVGPEGTTYVVKAGDMLMKISKKFYGDENKYKLIMDANGITDPNKIAEGQTLKIPPLK